MRLYPAIVLEGKPYGWASLDPQGRNIVGMFCRDVDGRRVLPLDLWLPPATGGTIPQPIRHWPMASELFFDVHPRHPSSVLGQDFLGLFWPRVIPRRPAVPSSPMLPSLAGGTLAVHARLKWAPPEDLLASLPAGAPAGLISGFVFRSVIGDGPESGTLRLGKSFLNRVFVLWQGGITFLLQLEPHQETVT